MPLVSVCIPTYNSAKYLGEAIESVLAQTFSRYELVICDNASTDGTEELCRKYSDARIRYVRFDTLVPQIPNWNRCLDLATSEYVVLLHADDILEPEFLASAVAIMNENPDVGLVHCSVRHIDEAGSPLQLQRLYETDRVDREWDLLKRLLLTGCKVNPAGVMVRRSIYISLGKFTDEIVWGSDWHMWIRIALNGPVAYLARPLARYRQHPQSGTSEVMATARNGEDELWVVKDAFNRIGEGSAELRSLRTAAIRGVSHRTWCFAERMCQMGFGRAARAGIRRAVAISPRMIADPKVAALWMATWVGYKRFAQLQAEATRLSRGR